MIRTIRFVGLELANEIERERKMLGRFGGEIKPSSSCSVARRARHSLEINEFGSKHLMKS